MRYEKAVETLIDYAMNQNGSGANAAAQVLLSSYNSYDFHLNVTNLLNLDQRGLEAALSLIEHRIHSRVEPHKVIEDGDRQFQELIKKWASLKNEFRHLDLYVDNPSVKAR